jgi:hypothetical protein
MPKFIHYGIANDNGDLIFDYPSIFYKTRMELAGKRFAMILEENIENATLTQKSYFIGILIKKYCVGKEVFGGHEQDEIIDYFLDRIFGEERQFNIKGKSIFKRYNPTISQLNKKQMSYLIDTVISLLSLEFGIEVEESDKYKQK